MPITTTVSSGGSPSGVNVTGEVRDASGGGGKDRKLTVLMSIEDRLVDLISVTPAPYDTQISDGHIQLWWKGFVVKRNSQRRITVRLRCKQGAHGPTQIGLAACTVDATLPADERFHASTGTVYHGHRCRTLIPWNGGRKPAPSRIRGKRA
jgi:hypothetical protein